ncbi:MAG: hypothetical protein OEV66_08845 [Spirochaetia bacterium]|nr:hypothetical protein [Spirochaetia bacterium]
MRKNNKNATVLKKVFFLFLIFILTAFQFSCDKFKDFESGTPEQIALKAVQAYNAKNPDRFLRLFSSRSVKKMDRSLQALRAQFKTLDPQYRRDLAEKMNMESNSLANLKMKDYILFNMNLKSGGMGSDNVLFPVDHVSEKEYKETKTEESKAVVRYENASIYFVKEKELWKIDTFDIVSKTPSHPDDSGE